MYVYISLVAESSILPIGLATTMGRASKSPMRLAPTMELTLKCPLGLEPTMEAYKIFGKAMQDQG